MMGAVSGTLSRGLLISALGALAAVAAAAALVAWPRRARPQPPQAPEATAGAPKPAPPPSAASVAELAALAPEGTTYLLATGDLPALAAELRAGAAGKIAGSPGAKRFLEVLGREPAGEFGRLYQALGLGLALAELSDGPACLVGWRSAAAGRPTRALAFRLRPGETGRGLGLAEAALGAAAGKVRDEPAGAGHLCRTAAAAGREGRAWGSAGGWLVIAESVAGCKELLDRALRPAPAARREELAKALAEAGAGRLVGYAELREALGPEACALLGLESAGRLGYSAGAGRDGRWTERLVLGGKPAQAGGVPGGLAAGGERPVLAGLPDSALGCLTFSVADGAKLWPELLKAVAPADPEGLLEAVAAQLAGAGGKDFATEVAPAFRGEVTVGWLLQRQALYPQVLVGAALAPGSARALGGGADAALELFGRGGTVASADYAGVRLAWLRGHSPVDPSCPAPSYAFQGERLLAASSTVPLKEFLAGRGARWLSAEEARRLGAGFLGARLDLKAAMPFIAAAAAGLRERLPAGAAGALPGPEELAGPLGAVELVAGRSDRGLWLEVRGPLPLVSAVAAAGLAWE